MSDESNSVEEKIKTVEITDVADSVWDEYDGQFVYVELKAPYCAVSNVSGFCIVEGQFLRHGLMQGIMKVKKDARGDIRLTIQSKDPAEGEPGFVRYDFEPELVLNITVTQRRLIQTP